jgi:Fur family ferric uptake transcriptional regulator
VATESTLDEALRTFDEFLRSRGLKMTEQRRTMVRVALDQRGHFSAEDLHQRLVGDGQAVSMATVYRALALLEEAAILQGHDFADGQRRYERMLRREHHDHIVCKDCGAVIEFQDGEIERLQEEVVHREGFRILDHVLNIYGACTAFRATGRCERRERVLRQAKHG